MYNLDLQYMYERNIISGFVILKNGGNIRLCSESVLSGLTCSAI